MFKQFKLNKKLFATLIIIGGIFGFIAAFTLLTNRIEFYKNPSFVPPCSINPWLDCGTVMKSKWATMFGFPNTIIGLTTYPVAIMVGVFLLMHDEINKKLLRFCILLSGLGFLTNNLYTYISSGVINSLCPWCLLAHTATTLVFFGLLSYAIINKQLTDKPELNEKLLVKIKRGDSVYLTILYFFLVISYVLLIIYLVNIRVIKDPLPDPIFWLYDKS
jgi:uncharacterized membrane protein